MKKKINDNENIVFISSTGGHWSQILELRKEMKELKNCYFITEYNETSKNHKDTFFLTQQDRKSKSFLIDIFKNSIKSIIYYKKLKPSIVISTGAGVVIPFLLISKMRGCKIIFIESFAKVNTPTITGKIVYKFADSFFVQWEDLLKYYKNAKYEGKVY